MEPASIINADVMLSRSMPSKAPIALDLYNIFSICTVSPPRDGLSGRQ